jgi:hypothetical protein
MMFMIGLRRSLVRPLMELGLQITTKESLQMRYLYREGEFPTHITSRRQWKLSQQPTPPSQEFQILDMQDSYDDDELESYYKANAIFEGKDNIVGWIELIAPNTKLPHPAYKPYLLNRRNLLDRNIPLVEIDFVHWKRPTINSIPNYSANEPYSTPYSVFIIPSGQNPKEHTKMTYRPIGIDEPLPAFTMPLQNGKSIFIDLESNYQNAFEDAGYGADLDYALPPLNFDSYSDEDKHKIMEVMRRIEKQEA